MIDEQFDTGPRIILVEHIIRRGWDGPGRIRGYCWGGQAEAMERCAHLRPEDAGSVAVRPYDTRERRWVDTDSPAWNPEVHRIAARLDAAPAGEEADHGLRSVPSPEGDGL